MCSFGGRSFLSIKLGWVIKFFFFQGNHVTPRNFTWRAGNYSLSCIVLDENNTIIIFSALKCFAERCFQFMDLLKTTLNSSRSIKTCDR